MKFVSSESLHGTDTLSRSLCSLNYQIRTHTQSALSISPRTAHGSTSYWHEDETAVALPLTVGREKSLMFYFMCQTPVSNEEICCITRFWNKVEKLSQRLSAIETLVVIKAPCARYPHHLSLGCQSNTGISVPSQQKN